MTDPTNNSNRALQIVGASGSVHAYANATAVSALTDYSVTFDMYIPTTVTAGKGIQIGLRYANANNYYGVEFFAGGNAYFFKKTTAGGQTWLPGGTATQLMTANVGSGVWETYKLTISGTGAATTLSLYRKVSGAFVLQKAAEIDGTSTANLASGPFALIADQSPVTVLFDNIIYQ